MPLTAKQPKAIRPARLEVVKPGTILAPDGRVITCVNPAPDPARVQDILDATPEELERRKDANETWRLADFGPYLGGSDAGVLMAWKENWDAPPHGRSMLQTFKKQIGEIEADNLDWNMSVRIGNALERHIIEVFSHESGMKIVKSKTALVEGTWLYANPDGLMGKDSIIEVKTVGGLKGQEYGKPYTDQIPRDYYCQMQLEMAATGRNSGTMLALMLSGPAPQIAVYKIARHQELIDRMIEASNEYAYEHYFPNSPPSLQRMRTAEDVRSDWRLRHPVTAPTFALIDVKDKKLMAAVMMLAKCREIGSMVAKVEAVLEKDIDEVVAGHSAMLGPNKERLVGVRDFMVDGKLNQEKLVHNLMQEEGMDRERVDRLIEASRGEATQRKFWVVDKKGMEAFRDTYPDFLETHLAESMEKIGELMRRMNSVANLEGVENPLKRVALPSPPVPEPDEEVGLGR